MSPIWSGQDLAQRGLSLRELAQHDDVARLAAAAGQRTPSPEDAVKERSALQRGSQEPPAQAQMNVEDGGSVSRAPSGSARAQHSFLSNIFNFSEPAPPAADDLHT